MHAQDQIPAKVCEELTSDLWLGGVILRVLRFPPPITPSLLQLTATLQKK